MRDEGRHRSNATCERGHDPPAGPPVRAAPFTLSGEPGELAASLDEGRTYFDVTAFEADASGLLGATVEVAPRGPGVDVQEREALGGVCGAA